ncbi:hypothetical protein C8R44DRAFT_736374 [Mycena epipterygia]|nr:hypothetical protein C8R44DRAFT_736374 [Mycena epipterygia]
MPRATTELHTCPLHQLAEGVHSIQTYMCSRPRPASTCSQSPPNPDIDVRTSRPELIPLDTRKCASVEPTTCKAGAYDGAEIQERRWCSASSPSRLLAPPRPQQDQARVPASAVQDLPLRSRFPPPVCKYALCAPAMGFVAQHETAPHPLHLLLSRVLDVAAPHRSGHGLPRPA